MTSTQKKNSASIHSMTGFANVQQSTRAGTLTMELRSVNSRFLDLTFRMPDDLRVFEGMIRERLTHNFSRGKMECRLSWGRADGEKRIPQVDMGLMEQLAALETRIREAWPNVGGFHITDILSWPGVVEDNRLDTDELQATLVALCDQAIEAMKATRQREGAQLAQVLLQKTEGMVLIVETLRPRLPEFLAHYEAKVRDRMAEQFDHVLKEKAPHLTREDLEERIKHEVALHSVRIDVQEELDRLSTHFVEVRRILAQGGLAGKRLDFLTQELNREANTLGSKAHAIAQTQVSIELKVLVEQFREQIQNIE